MQPGGNWIASLEKPSGKQTTSAVHLSFQRFHSLHLWTPAIGVFSKGSFRYYFPWVFIYILLHFSFDHPNSIAKRYASNGRGRESTNETTGLAECRRHIAVAFFFLRGARPKKKKINLGAQKKMGYIFFLAIPLAHKFMLLTNCFQ